MSFRCDFLEYIVNILMSIPYELQGSERLSREDCIAMALSLKHETSPGYGVEN